MTPTSWSTLPDAKTKTQSEYPKSIIDNHRTFRIYSEKNAAQILKTILVLVIWGFMWKTTETLCACHELKCQDHFGCNILNELVRSGCFWSLDCNVLQYVINLPTFFASMGFCAEAICTKCPLTWIIVSFALRKNLPFDFTDKEPTVESGRNLYVHISTQSASNKLVIPALSSILSMGLVFIDSSVNYIEDSKCSRV